MDKLDENKNIPDFKPTTEAIYAQVNQEHSKVSAKNLKDRNTVEVHNKASPITEEIRDNSTNTTFSPHNGVDFNNTEHTEAAQIKLGQRWMEIRPTLPTHICLSILLGVCKNVLDVRVQFFIPY